jgi:hypothetical protein
MTAALSTALRVTGAVLGGYAFSAACVALASVTLPLATGMAHSEAVLLASMLGFVLYLVALIWAFAERVLWRVWGVFAGGGALGLALTLVLIH